MLLSSGAKEKSNSSASKHIYDMITADKIWIYSYESRTKESIVCVLQNVQQDLFVNETLQRKWLLFREPPQIVEINLPQTSDYVGQGMGSLLSIHWLEKIMSR